MRKEIIQTIITIIVCIFIISSTSFAITLLQPFQGGTGTGTAPTSGQLLIGTSGGVYVPATLTDGANITITEGSGTITIAAAGGGSYTASGTLLNLTGAAFSVNEGTLTDTKACIYTAGTGLVCNSTFLTSYSETDPQVDTLTASKWCVSNVGGTAIDCAANAPILNEVDPTVDTAAEILAIIDDTALNFGTGVLTATGFSGPLTGAVTGNASTATALAANGANCNAGNAPLGVDASGAVESCFDIWTEAENTAAGYISATLTEEQVEDFVGGMLGGTETHITVTYQDDTNDIDFVVSDDWWDALTDMVLTDTYLYIGNASNDPVGVAMSGEASITNLGAVSVLAMEGVDWGTMTDTKVCIYDLAGTEVDCATTMTPDQVGTLTNTKWCTTDGSVVNCDTNAPVLTEVDPSVDSEAEIEAIMGIAFGASKVNTSGYIWVADGTDFESVAMSGDITIASGGATTIGANKILESMLKAVDAAADEECLTYETTTGDFEWQVCGGGVPTTITVADTVDTTSYVALFEDATGDLGPKTDLGITYNAGTGMLTAIGFSGPLTGNVTGNVSGTAATVTGAAQTAITSLGTLTILTVDNIGIDLNTISSSTGNINITPIAGSNITLDGTVTIDAGVVAGITSLGISAGALTNASVVVADLASADFGSFTCNGTACTIDATSVTAAMLASADFGGFTCNGTTCTVDSDATWTLHNGYPSACTNQFVRGIGDTLTCATVDISADTNLAAGRSLTMSGDSVEADAELFTDTKCIWIENPVATDDLKSIWRAKIAATLTSIWAESDQTVTFMLQVDDGTPADVDSVDLAPAAGTAEDTALNGDATMAAGDRLDIDLVSVANTPTWVSICWTLQYDD